MYFVGITITPKNTYTPPLLIQVTPKQIFKLENTSELTVSSYVYTVNIFRGVFTNAPFHHAMWDIYLPSMHGRSRYYLVRSGQTTWSKKATSDSKTGENKIWGKCQVLPDCCKSKTTFYAKNKSISTIISKNTIKKPSW